MDEIFDEDLDAEMAELEAGEIEPEPPAEKTAAEVKIDQDPEPEEDLSAKVEALTKEKTGLYREMIAEREQRQALKSQMDNITQALAEIRESRKSGAKDQGDDEPVKQKVSGIPVKFDDDGNPYVDPSDLKGLQPEELKTVKAEVAQMKNAGQRQEVARQNQEIISQVMAKDERYAEAIQGLNTAYQYLDAKTAEVMAKHGLTLKTTNIEHVMGLLEKEIGEEFDAHFPGLSIDDVIEAMIPGQNGLYNGRKLQKALKSIAATTVTKKTGNGQEKFNNLKLMASKPSNLSTTRNQKGATGRTLSDIADMGVDDIMNMSDADFKKIERALMGAGG
jgi:hypothetical protein